MRRFPLLVPALVASAWLAAAIGFTGCRSKPGINAAAGWASTPGMTGPAFDLGLGEYELDPFGSPDGDSATSSTAQPAQADPALAVLSKDLEAKSAALDARLKGLEEASAKAAEAAKDLPARVASGELSPEQAESLRKASAASDESLSLAREASNDAKAGKKAADAALAEYLALKTRLETAERDLKPPGWLPKDLTIPSIVTFLLGWGAYILRKRGLAGLKAQVAEALAKARRMTEEAVATFDDLPDTADVNAVRAAVRARTEDVLAAAKV